MEYILEIKIKNLKKLILESLDRFATDDCNDPNDEENYWKVLAEKIENNIEMTEQEIQDLNQCVRICTIFKDFNYKEEIKS